MSRTALARWLAAIWLAAIWLVIPAAAAQEPDPVTATDPGGTTERTIPAPNTAHADAPEPPPADAQLPAPVTLTEEQEERARALEGGLRCPVCQSQSIRQSRSFMAEDMRRQVRALIAEGRTDEEIRQYFVGRYGTWVLLTPPKSGFNLAAYLLPALVVLVGAAGLVLAACRRSRTSQGAETPVPPPVSPELARLEQELEEIER